MRRFIGCFGIAIFVLAIAGCKKEIPEPELIDPIYSDLQKRADDSQKAIDAELKKQGELAHSIEKDEPRSIELKNHERDLEKSKNLTLGLQQQALYYQIRSQRRKLVDRITYKEAFVKNQPWPDPHEYSEYQVNMRLQEVPRNWSKRVPKLQDRLANAAPKPTKPEGGGEKSAE